MADVYDLYRKLAGMKGTSLVVTKQVFERDPTRAFETIFRPKLGPVTKAARARKPTRGK